MVVLNQEYVLSHMPRRLAESNKGHYGRLLCVAGCTTFRGAAQLCALGGLRGGAGIVTLASTERVIAAAAASLPECIYLPCEESETGGISASAIPALLADAAKSKAVVLGCGMGDFPDTAALARGISEACAFPLVLDADGLNALHGQMPHREDALVITPHPGEMARLTGLTIAQIESRREETALEYAAAHGCIVVLKGHRTVIAGPEGDVFLNSTGNAGMARGGSGDLLAGLIGALLAQGLSPLDAACCGVWLHGMAGDRCAARLSQQAMLPHDMTYDLCKYLAENGL